jgi:hypothetical protein
MVNRTDVQTEARYCASEGKVNHPMAHARRPCARDLYETQRDQRVD